MKICSIVVLYEPNNKEIENILDYYDSVDKAYILDNSVQSKKIIVNDVLSKRNGCVKEKAEYIHFHKNIGLCKALNHGMKLAADEGFEWALLMDSDSTFNTNVINAYKDYIKEHNCEKIGVLAPVHLHDRNLEKKFEGQRDVSWAMTSGCLYNISIFKTANGFKEELFVDGLDIDYCYKIRRDGYRIVELANAQINHKPGETRVFGLGRAKVKYGVASPWRYYMQARAIVWLILEYRAVREIVRYSVKWGKVLLLFDNKGEYIKQLIHGTKDGMKLWKSAHD